MSESDAGCFIEPCPSGIGAAVREGLIHSRKDHTRLLVRTNSTESHEACEPAHLQTPGVAARRSSVAI